MDVQGELKSNAEPVNWSIKITLPRGVSSEERPSKFKCLKSIDSDMANQNVHHALCKTAVIFLVASATRGQSVNNLKTT